MISSVAVLLFQLLLLDVDPLVVVAVVAGVCRLLLDSESLWTVSSSLCLLSLLSPPLPVPRAAAGALASLPVPAPAPPPPVPGSGPVSPSVPAPAPLPPVPGATPVPPPIPVSLPAPVPPSVVPAGVADVDVSPALASVAQAATCTDILPTLD